MANWFECKVTYEKMVDNGTPKRTSEGYLVQGDTYTEIEARLTEELSSFTSLGELIINTIKRIKLAELFLSDHPEDDRFYRCKVNFISLDETRGVEKRTAAAMIVQSDSLPNAHKRLEKEMSTTLSPYEIAAITETIIMDAWPIDFSKPNE